MNNPRHKSQTFLLAALVWMGLSIGLVGCSGDDGAGPNEIHDSPDFVDAYPFLFATLQPDSTYTVTGRIELHFGTYLMPVDLVVDNSQMVGCMGSSTQQDDEIYYDGADWSQMEQATVQLNGVDFLLDEEQSHFTPDNFRSGWGVFAPPEPDGLHLVPGDTFLWNIQVDSLQTHLQGGFQTFPEELVVADPVFPVLPEDGTVVAPGETITVLYSDNEPFFYSLRLFEGPIDGSPVASVSRHSIDTLSSTLTIPSSLASDTLKLMCSRQGAALEYRLVRTLIVDRSGQ